MASSVAVAAREVFVTDDGLRQLAMRGLKLFSTKKGAAKWMLVLLADEVIPGTNRKYTLTTLEYVLGGFKR